MRPQRPVLDIFIGRDTDAWRLYVAPESWRPGLLRMRMDAHGEIFPVSQPDPADLKRVMWEADSPYEHRRTCDGGVEILAKGRSAVTLLVWLEDLIQSAPTST